jgi:hypothetical protein
MTGWRVYQHFFNYKHICGEDPITECTHEECVLFFIAKTKATKEMVEESALAAMQSIATKITNDNIITYDFGSLTTDEMLDDVKKLFLTNLPDGNLLTHLLLKKQGEFVFWD